MKSELESNPLSLLLTLHSRDSAQTTLHTETMPEEADGPRELFTFLLIALF